MVKQLSKAAENKRLKKIALFDSAFELFSTKGFNETAISDIVKKAGVAKGTFYLYFKDKYDLLDKIILKKSSVILKEDYEATSSKNLSDFTESIIYFTDYVIEYLKTNRILLKIIYKNLSWGLFRKAVADKEHYKETKDIYEMFIEGLKVNSLYTVEEDVEKTLFMIIELVGSVCYSSIILEEPSSIDEMKPILFNMIRKMLKK